METNLDTEKDQTTKKVKTTEKVEEGPILGKEMIQEVPEGTAEDLLVHPRKLKLKLLGSI